MNKIVKYHDALLHHSNTGHFPPPRMLFLFSYVQNSYRENEQHIFSIRQSFGIVHGQNTFSCVLLGGFFATDSESASVALLATKSILGTDFASFVDRVDFISCGEKYGPSLKLMNGLLHLQNKVLSTKVKSCKEGKVALETSSFVSFDSVSTFRKTTNKIRLADQKVHAISTSRLHFQRNYL